MLTKETIHYYVHNDEALINAIQGITRNVIANEFEPDSIDRKVVDELICNAVWSAEDDLENYIYENLNK